MFIVFISFRRQFGAPEVFFPWAPSLSLKLHGAPSRYVDLPLFFLSCPLFLSFFLSFSLSSSFFFLSFSLSVSFPFLFFLSFWSPLWWPRRARSPKAPQDTSLPLCCLYPPVCLCLLCFFVLFSRKFQPILQKVESREDAVINLSSIFLWFSPG